MTRALEDARIPRPAHPNRISKAYIQEAWNLRRMWRRRRATPGEASGDPRHKTGISVLPPGPPTAAHSFAQGRSLASRQRNDPGRALKRHDSSGRRDARQYRMGFVLHGGDGASAVPLRRVGAVGIGDQACGPGWRVWRVRRRMLMRLSAVPMPTVGAAAIGRLRQFRALVTATTRKSVIGQRPTPPVRTSAWRYRATAFAGLPPGGWR